MEHIRRFVQELTQAGYQLDRSAYDYLKSMDETQASKCEKTVLLTITEKPDTSRILTRQRLVEISTPEISTATQIVASVAQKIPAKQIESKCEVVRDPAKEIGTGGSIDDFSHYF